MSVTIDSSISRRREFAGRGATSFQIGFWSREWHEFFRLAKVTGGDSPAEVMPPEVLRYLVESDRANLDLLEKFLNACEPLTEVEKRYCEAEAIPLEDFIRRLPKR